MNVKVDDLLAVPSGFGALLFSLPIGPVLCAQMPHIEAMIDECSLT